MRTTALLPTGGEDDVLGYCVVRLLQAVDACAECDDASLSSATWTLVIVIVLVAGYAQGKHKLQDYLVRKLEELRQTALAPGGHSARALRVSSTTPRGLDVTMPDQKRQKLEEEAPKLVLWLRGFIMRDRGVPVTRLRAVATPDLHCTRPCDRLIHS